MIRSNSSFTLAQGPQPGHLAGRGLSGLGPHHGPTLPSLATSVPSESLTEACHSQAWRRSVLQVTCKLARVAAASRGSFGLCGRVPGRAFLPVAQRRVPCNFRGGGSQAGYESEATQSRA